MALVQRRIGLLFALFFALLSIAVLRAFYLGAVRGGSLSLLAASQQVRHEVVPAPRGAITDRNGLELAVSEPADDVAADPQLINDPATVATRIAPLLGQSQSHLLALLAHRSTGFVYLARALPDATAKALLALKITGISATPVMRRTYPRNSLAAQVLGLAGVDGQGLSGLEYFRNRALQGQAGQLRVIEDALGQPLSIDTLRAERAGTDLSLTLDSAIQGRAEDVLSAIASTYHPKDATAIVMNPNTGEILAMASWPTVDLNHPGAAGAESWTNRAVGFDFEPGSTFKVVTVAGALEEGLVTPGTSFYLPPQIQVADRTIHDAEVRPAETLTTAQILAQSSNVGAITIGLRLGASQFDRWVRRFGFGSPTGVDLPGEERGLVLPVSKYSGSSMGNLPIGQGEDVTPLQIATAYAAIANGGILRPPRIVHSEGGRALPPPPAHRVISATTAAELRQMLEGVLAPGGTASEVSIPGYPLAGKTGTASIFDASTGQYSQSRYVASFVGFAPANDPKLLAAVVVDQPQGAIYGGTVAAPAFGQIMSFALPYLGIPPG